MKYFSVFSASLAVFALMAGSFGAGSAQAEYSWTEDWLGAAFPPNWTESFPQTSDGYIANTGLDNSVTYSWGTWFDGVRGMFAVSTVTGAPDANRHLWNITRDASTVGTADFVAQMYFCISKAGADMGEIALKLVDSDENVIAAAYLYDPSATYNRFDLGDVVDPVTAPRDARSPDGNYHAVQQRPGTGGMQAHGLMEISRDAAGVCTFTFGSSANGAVGSYTTHYTYNMGTTTGSVADLQVSLGWTGTSRAHPWYVGPISISSSIPEPSSAVLLLSGLCLAMYAWLRRQR